jgi:tRNA threonylcarbamoyladenosine biosynthesis protein TsaB
LNRALQAAETPIWTAVLKGHDFSRADNRTKLNRALQAAETPSWTAVLKGHDFSRADNRTKLNPASAAEGWFPALATRCTSFSPACLAAAGRVPDISSLRPPFSATRPVAPNSDPFENSGSSPCGPHHLVLGIDTCGPTGSVALSRIAPGAVETLAEASLEGRTYSATLIAAISDLLDTHKLKLSAIHCLVVVRGPGSFTGVRVGLSAAKGLAEGAGLPVVAVSRLEVLAQKAAVPAAALDAHRHEIFLRHQGRELLAGPEELAAIDPPPSRIAVCDDASGVLLAQAWPATELVQVAPPTAADAIALAAPHFRAGGFDDVLLLDGHYLRRSDAEIFGEPASPAPHNGGHS